MSTAQAQGGTGKYLIVYICMLVLSAIELMIAYGHASGGHLLVSMLLPAFIGAALGVVYFMGLGSENQKAILAFCVFTLFVLATINYGWTDSFRILLGAPFSKYH